MNREVYLKDIRDNLAFLKSQVELSNAVSLYDINIVAEDFYERLLNLIYGYNLINANILEKNAPAIDLVDEKNKIAVQVTATNDSEKIKHTIREFIDNNKYEYFDRLVVLILTEKKNYTTHFDTQGLFDFDKKKDIWDITTLVEDMSSLDTSNLKDIRDFLDVEMHQKDDTQTMASEVETIIDLIEYISRHKEIDKTRKTIVDPSYKIYKRFRDFADRIINQYMQLRGIYGSAVEQVNAQLEVDEAQQLITMLFLQDISIKYLEQNNNDPIKALEALVDYFEKELSINGKKYDRLAIKFYLVDNIIKCNVFPNEEGEYDGSN